jgi:alpha-beta hydrolase superfamily lysophospholipase
MSDPDGDRKSLEPERRVAIRAVRACVIVAAFGALAASGASAAQNPFADLIGSGNSRRFAQEDEQISEKTGEARAYEIHYTKWQPATPNGKVIVYNHGFQSHRGWFYATANEFAGQGYAVYAFDRIGSGESSGGMAIDNGEVVDVRGHVRDWKLFLESVDLMLDVAVEENPGAELILWGNSYGAKVVTAYLYERGDRPAARDISAAVLTTPGNYRNKDGMPLPFSRVRLVSSGGLREFPVPMVERNGDNGASWFVAPGPWFDRIRDDELSLREVTRSYYMETNQLDKATNGRSKRTKLGVSAFYLMVRDDVMMNNDKMQKDIEEHASDSVFKYYAGGPENKHFLLFTEDREEAIADILAFLDGRLEKVKGAQRVGEGSPYND